MRFHDVREEPGKKFRAAALALAATTVALASNVEGVPAQAPPSSPVLVARTFRWVERGHEVVEEPAWSVLALGPDGAWIGCADATGVSAAGSFRAQVTAASWPAGSPGASFARPSVPNRARCEVTRIEEAPQEAIALFGGAPAHFGGFTLGIDGAALGTTLGVAPTTIPQETRARTLLAHGPYLLAMHHRLAVVAAYLDRLPGIAVSGAHTIPSTATFDGVRTTLDLTSTRALGRADVMQPDLSRALANELAASRVALGSQVGIAEVRGRVLVFAFGVLRHPAVLAHLRAVLIRHALDGTLAR